MRRIMPRLLTALGTTLLLAACGSSDSNNGDDDPSIDETDVGDLSGDTSTHVDSSKSDGESGTDSSAGSDTRGSGDSMTGGDSGLGSDTTFEGDSEGDGVASDGAGSDTRSGSDSAIDGGARTDSASADSGVKTDSASADTGSKIDSASLDTSVKVDSAADLGTSSDSGSSGSGPMIAGCRIFPPDNPWNLDISSYAKSADDATYRATMHGTTALHPDWGKWTDGYGIPYNTGTGATPVKMTWTVSWGSTESDKLACAGGAGEYCYPIPSSCKIEGGASASSKSDRHLLFIDTAGAPNNCTLYEIYNAQNWTGPGFTAQNGAIFPLGSNALRPDGWTSADAAGLPVLPGLVRYDEVAAGEIKHAIRFTMDNTYNGYIHPATHAAGLSSSTYPPMGLRMRLTKDISTYTGAAKIILTAMKKYGIILADNGSNWYMSGDSDDRWDPLMDGIISAFGSVHGSDFEAVDTGAVSTAGL